jgi:hypothetical protein
MFNNWRDALTRRLPAGLASRAGARRCVSAGALLTPRAADHHLSCVASGRPMQTRSHSHGVTPPPLNAPARAAFKRMVAGRNFVAGVKIWVVLSLALVLTLVTLQLTGLSGNLTLSFGFVAATLAVTERAEATLTNVRRGGADLIWCALQACVNGQARAGPLHGRRAV